MFEGYLTVLTLTYLFYCVPTCYRVYLQSDALGPRGGKQRKYSFRIISCIIMTTKVCRYFYFNWEFLFFSYMLRDVPDLFTLNTLTSCINISGTFLNNPYKYFRTATNYLYTYVRYVLRHLIYICQIRS